MRRSRHRKLYHKSFSTLRHISFAPQDSCIDERNNRDSFLRPRRFDSMVVNNRKCRVYRRPYWSVSFNVAFRAEYVELLRPMHSMKGN